MVDSCREISEHKRDTGATPGHELQLTLALEVAGTGTWDWLSPTDEMHWSIESLSLFGTARGCPPSFDAFMDRVHPGDRDQLRRRLDEGPEDVRLQAEALSDQLRDVASTLHRMSHRLHPALIHQVGLEKALRGLCDDVGRIQRLVVHCQFLYCGPAIDDDIALGLYRIAQEALTNVVKHSGGSRASVSLDATDERIVLNISDNGAGFDPTTSDANESLGLISMRERARLMNGRLNLITRPGAGTRVEVSVPATFNPVLTHTGSRLV